MVKLHLFDSIKKNKQFFQNYPITGHLTIGGIQVCVISEGEKLIALWFEETDKLPEALEDFVEYVSLSRVLTSLPSNQGGHYEYKSTEANVIVEACDSVDTPKKYAVLVHGKKYQEVVNLFHMIVSGDIKPDKIYDEDDGLFKVGLRDEDLESSSKGLVNNFLTKLKLLFFGIRL